jgi:hypothetical protein
MSQRMVGANAILRHQATLDRAGPLVGSTHRIAPSRNGGGMVVRREHKVDLKRVTFFRHPAGPLGLVLSNPQAC